MNANIYSMIVEERKREKSGEREITAFLVDVSLCRSPNCGE
jgi:hypothetical protein